MIFSSLRIMVSKPKTLVGIPVPILSKPERVVEVQETIFSAIETTVFVAGPMAFVMETAVFGSKALFSEAEPIFYATEEKVENVNTHSLV